MALTRRAGVAREIRCYLCGRRFEVPGRALSTTCPGCHKAIKVEDVVVKSYVPVTDLATCGTIRVTPKGRVAAKRVQSGGPLEIEGVVEGEIQAEGPVRLGAKSSWKGKRLAGRTLKVADGAKLDGFVEVPKRE